MLWVEKYRPRSLKDIIGNHSAKEIVRSWAESWKQGKREKPLLLVGPPGVGKTATAWALANEYGWDVIEMNASDTRDKATVEKVIGAASTSSSLFGGLKLILIDEVDGLTALDRGGLSVILKILQTSTNPVILTANDAYAEPVSYIKQYVITVEYKRVSVRELVVFLERILRNEGIEYEREALELIAKRSNGDVRSALLDLQAAATYGRITLDIVKDLGYRDRETNIFEVLGRIFKSEEVMRPYALLSTLDVDPDMFKLWLAENVPREYERPEEIAEAFRWLSRADVFEGRIVRRQYWRFLAYAQEIAVNGVIIAKKRKYRKFTRYSFPEWIRERARHRKRVDMRKKVAEKIGKLLHLSSKRVIQDVFPLLPILLEDERFKHYLERRGRLSKEEIAFLESLSS